MQDGGAPSRLLGWRSLKQAKQASERASNAAKRNSCCTSERAGAKVAANDLAPAVLFQCAQGGGGAGPHQTGTSGGLHSSSTSRLPFDPSLSVSVGECERASWLAMVGGRRLLRSHMCVLRAMEAPSAPTEAGAASVQRAMGPVWRHTTRPQHQRQREGMRQNRRSTLTRRARGPVASASCVGVWERPQIQTHTSGAPRPLAGGSRGS